MNASLQLACKTSSKTYATGCAKLETLSIKLSSLCNFCGLSGLRRGEVYGFTDATWVALRTLQVFAEWIITGLWTELEMENIFCPPLTYSEHGSVAFQINRHAGFVLPFVPVVDTTIVLSFQLSKTWAMAACLCGCYAFLSPTQLFPVELHQEASPRMLPSQYVCLNVSTSTVGLVYYPL